MLRLPAINRAFHVALIALVGLTAYSNTLDAPFQFDDFDYIVNNPLIKNFPFPGPSADMLSRLSGNVRDTVKTRYIGYLSFSVNYRLHGLDVRGYHTANTLIHLLNGILLYMIVLLVFRTPRMRGTLSHAGHAALFASMLFVAHPLQTEAVTYISQRFTSLAALFCLASLLFYIKWRLSGVPENGLRPTKPSHSMYVLSIVSSALAMFTKENSFTFPLVIEYDSYS